MRRVLGAMTLVLAAAGLTACGNYTCYQTARSLDAGSFSGDFTASGAGFDKKLFLSMRGRAGLGKGLDAGIEIANPIPFPTGAGAGALPASGTVDLKFQFLRQEEPDDETWRLISGAPVSAAVDVAWGTGFNIEYRFAQLIASRRFDTVEPYVAYRFQNVDLDFVPGDPDDLDDADLTSFGELIRDTGMTSFDLHHVFVGIRFHLGGGVYFGPEVSYVDAPGGHEILGSFGIVIGKEVTPNAEP